MISLGEKLSQRYFVTQAIEPSHVGHFVEVRDAQGTVYSAQPLLSRALPPIALERLKSELSSIPTSPAFFKPDSLVWSPSGVPVTVFRIPPPKPFLPRLASLFAGPLEDRQRDAMKALLAWFVPLAEALNQLHQAGVIHGAISLTNLHIIEESNTEKLTLSGFGLDAADRYASNRPRPLPKTDFAALTLCLADAMDRIKARPEGPHLVRWEMLRNCARAGDHPALQSGLALSTTLQQILSDPWQRTAKLTLTGPDSPLPTQTSQTPPVTPATPSRESSPSSPSHGFVAPPEAPRSPPHRRAILFGSLIATLVLVGSSAVYFLRDKPNGNNTLPGPITLRVTPRCDGEDPTHPPSVDFPSAITSLTASCLGGVDPGLVAFALTNNTLGFTQRTARRGSHWGPITPLSDHVAELGTALHGTDTDPGYISWRNLGTPAFTVATLDRTVTPIAFDTPGWTGETFLHPVLLRADTDNAWIATTYTPGTPDSTPSVVAVHLTHTAENNATTTVFRITDGVLLSAIPGDPASLLVGRPASSPQNLSLITLPVAALPGLVPNAPDILSTDAGAITPQLRIVPQSVLQVLLAPSLGTTVISSAPLGLGTPTSARRFLITLGTPRPCTTPPCPPSGDSRLITFQPQGEPTVLDFVPNSRAMGLFSAPPSTSLVWIERDTPPHAAVWSLSPDNTATSGAWMQGSLTHADVLHCGDDHWQLAVSTSFPNRITALPLACSRARVTLPTPRPLP